ncbi:Uncharacterized conserved protein [Rhizobiales bacterium GAS113]|nr:Uncharacterized conserved protein [Rhizobiales bacterium GAS113]
MSATISGGCGCGKIRYESSALPLASLYCQCRDCQHDSGTGHSCHVMLPKAALNIEGRIRLFHGFADSGNAVERGFCPDCGSSVTYASTAFPDAIFVTAGSLDDPSWFRPTMVVYISSAQPWDHIEAHLPRFEGMPPLGRPTA